MSPTSLSWRWHIASNTVFILAFLNYLLLLLFFFPKDIPRYYFPNYWPLFLVTCNFHLPWRSGQSHGRKGWKCEGSFAQNPHGSKTPPKPHHESKGVEIRGRRWETESRSSHFPRTTQEKRRVRHSGHRPARSLLSPPWAGCRMNTPPRTRLWPLQNILLTQVPIVWHLREIWPSSVRRCCLESCWCVILLPRYF